MPARTHYETLGLPRGADAEAIKRAYRTLAVKHHPDRSTAKDAVTRFAAISTAHAVLSDPAKRAAYDAELILAELAAAPPPPPRPTPSTASIADDPVFVEMRDYVTRRREQAEAIRYGTPAHTERRAPRWAAGPVAWLLYVVVPAALSARLDEGMPIIGWSVVAFAQLVAAGRRSPLAMTHRFIVNFFR